MKKIYAVFLSTLLFTSCLNDFLDVDPVSDIATSTFWQTDNDVRAALILFMRISRQTIIRTVPVII